MEMVVLVALLGILAGMAVATLSQLRGQRNRLAAVEMEKHLLVARSLAVRRERATRIVFSVVSNSYAVLIADTHAPGGYAPARDPVTQTDWVVAISNRFSGVALQSVDIGGDNVLCFEEASGVPCDGSLSRLTVTGRVTFRSGISVGISPETGYVSVSE